MILMSLGLTATDPSWRTVRQPLNVDAVIARYWARYHKRLAALAQMSGRHADLLVSFPASAVAIVSRPPADSARQEALRLVAEGAPLAHIAHALGLPLWFRKLPPEALATPLAERMPRAMRDTSVGARLLNTMPDATGRADRWLQAVIEAFTLADAETAVWMGGQRIFRLRRPPVVPVLPLAMYRWYTQHPELAAGRQLSRGFDPRMSLGRAALITRHWLLRALQDLCSDAANADNTWCALQEVDGVSFVPLLTSGQIVEEGVAMAHCVATYVPYVVHGHCRLYSLRAAGKRLATMEVRLCEGTGLPHINQIKGVHNAAPSSALWQTAVAWLEQRVQQPGHLVAFRSSGHSAKAFDERVWSPFAQHLSRAADGSSRPPPGLPDMLKALRELELLERC